MEGGNERYTQNNLAIMIARALHETCKIRSDHYTGKAGPEVCSGCPWMYIRDLKYYLSTMEVEDREIAGADSNYLIGCAYFPYNKFLPVVPDYYWQNLHGSPVNSNPVIRYANFIFAMEIAPQLTIKPPYQ